MSDDDKTTPGEPVQMPEQPAGPAEGPLAAPVKDLLLEAQKACAALDRVPVGSYRCKCGCGQVKKWDDPGCQPEEPLEVLEARRRRNELREFLDKAYATIPDGMGWCRYDNEQWQERMKGVVMHGPDNYREKASSLRWKRAAGSMLLWGKTGAGKTISALAILHHVLDCARDLPEEKVSNRALQWAAGAAFVSAPTLAFAWRNSELGEEPAIVQLAKRASLLVLDEIGHEYFNPEMPVLLELMDHRYLKKGRPTIITTELSEAQFMARYRPALYRRIRDLGTVRELKKG